MLLRFELVSNSNYTAIAEYIDFKIGPESSDYMATFGPAVLRSGIMEVGLQVTKLTAVIPDVGECLNSRLNERLVV